MTLFQLSSENSKSFKNFALEGKGAGLLPRRYGTLILLWSGHKDAVSRGERVQVIDGGLRDRRVA